MNLTLTKGGRQIVTSLLLCLGVAFLATDFSVSQVPLLQEGDIANQDIVAVRNFEYLDQEETEKLRNNLRENPYSVYQLDVSSASNIQYKISNAFQKARKSYQEETRKKQEQEKKASDDELVKLAEEFSTAINDIRGDFTERSGLELEHSVEIALMESGWDIQIEQMSLRLVDESMKSFIIDSAVNIPREGDSFDVVRLFVDQQDHITMNEHRNIKTLTEAKQFITVLADNISGVSEENAKIATSIAREAIKVNFIYDYSRTKQYVEKKIKDVKPVIHSIDRGLSLVRKGDRISPKQAQLLEAMLSNTEEGLGVWGQLLSLFVLCAFVVISMYSFASSYIRKFVNTMRSIETMALLSLLVVLFGRLFVETSFSLSSQLDWGMGEHALWYATPFAAGSMVIRILLNSETALVWIVCTALFLALSMEQSILFGLFFIVSGVVAAASLVHTKDRVNILRAGFQAGLINAALALMIELSLFQLDGNSSGLTTRQPLWEAAFALSGGILSSFIALGLIPLFEMLGFVTDYKMLELANLNHPLLRQLFLRAPGTYHHSMTMAQLSEAAAEEIGANALQTKVACYYHDIGKSLQPQFFIENQRGINPHDALAPHQSARVIMTHVIDGLALAKQHDLPKPILDAISMHHGTGVIKYFYIKAMEAAKEGEHIDERDFRYNGKRPNTREAGIIFLADRVEAACRTLKEPDYDDFYQMIQNLVNGAITDGQLEECPLTIKELYTIMNVFAKTMTGIYHHRIEYPTMPQAQQKKAANSGIITLETPNPFAREKEEKHEKTEVSDGN